jgi:hypothetical protein
MKKALLLVAILVVSAPCFGQSLGDRGSTRSSANTARFVGRSWVHVDTYDSFDSNISVGTSGWAPARGSAPSGPSITVYGASGWAPSAGQSGSDWQFMQFGDTGKISPAAFNGTPSLGAIARQAREAKAQQPQTDKPLKIKMDGNGALVVAPRK